MDKEITSEVLELMKSIQFSIDSEEKIDVQDGMTRAMEDNTTTTASAMGRTFRKVEKKIVTVTPLAK